MMTFEEEYNIEKDKYVKNYFNVKDDLRKDTVNSYKFSLKQFALANEETITKMVDNCLKQQKSRVEKDGQITEFNPNHPNSLIIQYLDNFKEFCIKKGNKNTSINDKTENILVFLNFYNVKMPRRKKLENDKEEWYRLTKEDVRYILKDCNTTQQGLITFMLSTGLRRWDISELTIGVFMEATKKMDYHNFVEVDEFIDKAPDNMIGFWDLIPHKESRNKIPCKTFNSPESSNLILQNLRRIKNEYIPNKEKKDGIKIKLEKGDALFGSRKKYYKETLTKEAMTNAIRSKDPRFKEWKIKQIDEKIKNKKISKEDREKEIKKIPTINPHALRKIFINAVDTHGGLSLRANLLMEGHSSKVPTDTNYLKKEKEELFIGYKRILPHLTIMEDIEVRLLTNEEGEELHNKVTILETEKKSLEKKLEKLEKENNKMRTQNEEFKKEIQGKIKQLEPFEYQDTTNPKANILSPGHQAFIHVSIDEYIDFCNQKNEKLTQLKLTNGEITEEEAKNEKITKLDKKLQSYTNKEIEAIKEITYNLAIHDENFRNENEIRPIVQKAITKITRDPQILKDTMQVLTERNLNQEKLEKYHKLLYQELDDMGIYEEDEIETLCDIISFNFNQNVDKILMEDITKELIQADIDKYT